MKVREETPHSLHGVAQSCVQGNRDYTSCMKEFIDFLIREVSDLDWDENSLAIPFDRSLFEQEPPFIENPVERAHIGAMAEHLAHLSNQPCPQWCLKPCYFLDTPVYFGRAHSRACMMRDTPAAFRRRHLFCGKPLIKLFEVRHQKRARRG